MRSPTSTWKKNNWRKNQAIWKCIFRWKERKFFFSTMLKHVRLPVILRFDGLLLFHFRLSSSCLFLVNLFFDFPFLVFEFVFVCEIYQKLKPDLRSLGNNVKSNGFRGKSAALFFYFFCIVPYTLWIHPHNWNCVIHSTIHMKQTKKHSNWYHTHRRHSSHSWTIKRRQLISWACITWNWIH